MAHNTGGYDRVIIWFSVIFFFIVIAVGMLVYVRSDDIRSRAEKTVSETTDTAETADISHDESPDIDTALPPSPRAAAKLFIPADAENITLEVVIADADGETIFRKHSFTVPVGDTDRPLRVSMELTGETEKQQAAPDGIINYHITVTDRAGDTLFTTRDGPVAWFTGNAGNNGVSTRTLRPVDLRKNTTVLFRTFTRQQDMLLFRFRLSDAEEKHM